jgi:hypothetical protein
MTGPTTEILLSAKARLTCAAIVFAVALALYAVTLAPTVTLVDSGELIAAAHSRGVAHPPGFPLYVLLAHVATLFPAASVAARVNFASALFAAMAAAMLSLVVAEAILIAARLSSEKGRAHKKPDRGKKTRKQAASEARPEEAEGGRVARVIALAPPLAAGLLLAFSRTLWAYATIAEVYALNALLLLVVFFLMLRWRRERLTRGRGDSSPRHRHLYLAAFVFGLALGVHHVTVGMMIFALAYLVYSTEGARFFTSRGLIYATVAAMAGLAVYAYLPVAARSQPVMNWGDPQTLERFWWHVTGRQYQVFFSPSIDTMFRQVPEFFKLALREFGPVWLPVGLALGLLGLAASFKRDRTLFWFLILVIAGDLIYALNYEIAEDKDAYYLPAFIAIAIAAGSGAEWLIRSAKLNRLSPAAARYATAAIVLLISLSALAFNLPYNNRSRYYVARDYVENVFKTIEPGGLLLTGDWQLYSPMFYLQQVERKRADVVAIDIKMLRRSWYFDHLRQAYPQLIDRTRDKVEAFLEDLRQWEQDPDLYQRDLNLNRRINSRFNDMILSFVGTHIQSGAVYVTNDIATGLDPNDAELTNSLSRTYQLFPQGLVFQVARDREFHLPAEPDLETRGLADGTIRFESDDTVRVKVLPVYVVMLYNRGAYLAAHNRHEQAVRAFEQSLGLDSNFSRARQGLNASLAALRNGGAN